MSQPVAADSAPAAAANASPTNRRASMTPTRESNEQAAVATQAEDAALHDLASLSQEQRGKIEATREALVGDGQEPCDDATLFRYLVANDWSVTRAALHVVDNKRWHEEHFRSGAISILDVHEELMKGKFFVLPATLDKAGRPVLVFRPRFVEGARQDTLALVKLLVYSIERTIENMPEGQHQLTYIVDLSGIKFGNFNPRVARALLETLEQRYPERLAQIIIYNNPAIYVVMWKIISRFMPDILRRKIQFGVRQNRLHSEFIDPAMLPAEYGGSLDFDFRQWARERFEVEGKSFDEAKGGGEAGGGGGGSDIDASILDALSDMSVAERMEGSIRTGHLQKLGGIVKNWKRRFFVLKGPLLYYYSDENAPTPNGCVMLERTEIRDAEPSECKGKANAFCVVAHMRTWVFVAESEQDKNEWMEAMRACW